MNRAELLRLPAAKPRIDAVSTGPGARTGKAEDARGLQNQLRLAVGARVLLRLNLWVEAGLTNGALGKVLGILYEPGHAPPTLPLAVLLVCQHSTGGARARVHL